MTHMAPFNLASLYEAQHGPVFMSGIQALVKLPLLQREADRRRGLNTAGLVSGYRGSPLGAYDQQLWKAEKQLKANDILFQPGLNEDLAATALWGAQMHRAYGPARVDGVFGIWYGKGPGVDRTGDVFRNANMVGTSPLGGVLAVAGDDHAAQSSMFPHQTDGIFQSVMMPILQPASVGEILSLGLAGLALSRFSGLWVTLKTVAEVVEGAAAFDLPDADWIYETPSHLVPSHGLNWDPHIKWPADRIEFERRMIEERQPAAVGWATANSIDRPIMSAPRTRLGIVTVGKAHQDVMQALDRLGIDKHQADALGLSIYKVAMSWPLASAALIAFFDEAEEILVVEEKAPIVENQLKAALFNRPGRKPRVIGKTGPGDEPLLPVIMELSPLMVGRVIAARLGDAGAIDMGSRLSAWERRAAEPPALPFPVRKPFFCSGCPHNSSTVTPEGAVSGGGIGCHAMAIAMPDRRTPTFSQMGGEGMQWAGAAPFSNTRHIFQNLGDGTYQHSGLLAIRAAVAAGTSITFKILYNDAVAMTGGQPAEGNIDPALITRQLAAEAVAEIHLVSDDPEKWRKAGGLAEGVRIAHRDELDAVQRRLREVPGVTVIIYEQTCAAEKRRRRKRRDFPDPDRRLFINAAVCEGCGDCSVQSNCIAVEPLETAFGRKRRINQSSCNKDFSCVKGFCPSFVDLEGPVLRKPDSRHLKAIEEVQFASLPMPTIATPAESWNIYVAGIGGLGVLTIGAMLGVAAHLDSLEATVLDFTGLAQKNGGVVSQVRIGPKGKPLHAVRIGAGEVDTLLATDLVVSAGRETLSKLNPERSRAVINRDLAPTADAVTDRDTTLPGGEMLDALNRATGGRSLSLRATRIAEGLFGDGIAANTLMLGFAWQQGLIPLSLSAIRGAIEANGAAVSLNLRAFDWGRVAARDMAAVEDAAGLRQSERRPETLRDMIARLGAELEAYQDADYAARYAGLLGDALQAARDFGDDGERYVRAVAANAYKLMAYKDEYEVARLYALPAFRESLGAQFASVKRLSIWLAPPFLARTDPATGRPKKRRFGPWIFPIFSVLAGLRGLRGTAFDPFGRTEERKAERALRDEYLATIGALTATLDRDGLQRAIAVASLPDMVRGYGPVKERAIRAYREQREALLAAPLASALEEAA